MRLLLFILILLPTYSLFAQYAFVNERFVESNALSSLSKPTAYSTSSLHKPEDVQVRPFITDDARVVGNRLAQLESWVRLDRHAGEQWIMAAYGPSKKLELSLGGVFGYENEADGTHFAYGLPLIQAKFLFKDYKPNKAPGLGLVAGTFLPAGQGSFKPSGYGTFSFLTLSQCFGEGEKVLIHGNAGFNYLHIDGADEWLATWGIGSQVKTIGGFHLVGEVFSGDPYVPGTGIAYQAGFRHFFSDLVQIDMTLGEGISGSNKLPFWLSAGIRLVFTSFSKKAVPSSATP